MKAIVMESVKPYGDLSGLALADVDVPEPKAGEALIKVDAISLNYGDFELFAGGYTFDMTLPAIIGGEGSGTVEAVGADVRDLQVGDRVNTLPMFYDGYGVASEYAVYPAEYLRRYPDVLGPEEASCVWVAYMTAYFAFMEVAKVRAGEYVLITAASSSAGMAAMEFCRIVGAHTIGTSRTAEKREYLLERGFDFVIAQSEGEMSRQILDFSDGIGVRVVYDPIGGPIMQDYAQGLAKHAVILLYGGMDQSPTIIPEIEMTKQAAWLHTFSTFNHIDDSNGVNACVEFVNQSIIEGRLRPSVGAVYELSDYRQALRAQLDGIPRKGKIVLKP